MINCTKDKKLEEIVSNIFKMTIYAFVTVFNKLRVVKHLSEKVRVYDFAFATLYSE
jgi:hypothetical protein